MIFVPFNIVFSGNAISKENDPENTLCKYELGKIFSANNQKLTSLYHHITNID